MVIAICDDQKVYTDEIQSMVQSWKNKNNYNDVSMYVYHSTEDLLDDWEAQKLFDALFLDIEFKYMSGLSLAQKIRSQDPNIPIVLISNYEKYCLKGYEVSAYRFFVKPVQEADVHTCLDYCYRYVTHMVYDSFIVSKKGFLMRLPYNDVIYITCGIHSVSIYTKHEMVYHIPLRGTFENYTNGFPKDYFIRCHRGYLVNMLYVKKFTHSFITISGEINIPIGRKYSTETIHSLHQFFCKEWHT